MTLCGDFGCRLVTLVVGWHLWLGHLPPGVTCDVQPAHAKTLLLSFPQICVLELKLYYFEIMEFTEDEKQLLLQRLSEFPVKPKGDTKEDFLDWMKAVSGAQQSGDVTVKQENAPPAGLSGHDKIPRIPFFTGSAPTKAEHVSFEVWQYEVNCLLKSKRYEEHILLQAMRYSLRGDASKVAVRLGEDVTVSQMLERMCNLYGTVSVGQDVLAAFYSAHQEKDESIVAWSCRLEDLMQQAIIAKKLNVADRDEALRAKLWSGLRKELREISGHKYDAIGEYDKLLVELRKIEKDFGVIESTKKAQVHTAQTQDNDLRAMVKQLHEKFSEFEKRSYQTTPTYSSEVICWQCGQKGHVKSGCRNKPLNKSRPLARGSQQAEASKPRK